MTEHKQREQYEFVADWIGVCCEGWFPKEPCVRKSNRVGMSSDSTADRGGGLIAGRDAAPVAGRIFEDTAACARKREERTAYGKGKASFSLFWAVWVSPYGAVGDL